MPSGDRRAGLAADREHRNGFPHQLPPSRGGGGEASGHGGRLAHPSRFKSTRTPEGPVHVTACVVPFPSVHITEHPPGQSASFAQRGGAGCACRRQHSTRTLPSHASWSHDSHAGQGWVCSSPQPPGQMLQASPSFPIRGYCCSSRPQRTSAKAPTTASTTNTRERTRDVHAAAPCRSIEDGPRRLGLLLVRDRDR